MDLDLVERVAVITGASGGIGRGIAEALGRERVRLALVARGTAALYEVADAVNVQGAPRPVVFSMDLYAANAATQLHEQVTAELGPIDIIVNCAGTSARLGRASSTLAWKREIQLRFIFVLELVNAALANMQDRRWGRIVNIGGTAEPINQIDSDAISAATVINGARLLWAKSLSRQVARYGITVNTIVPGRILSRHTMETLFQDKASLEDFAQTHIPAGYIGEPSDIADLAAFLASHRARYITGEVIYIDGGLKLSAF
jgi:3-oxoacyl-[acyl-carrier protein] reductase